MNRSEIEEKVYDMVVLQFGVEKEQLTPESRFVEDLGADSLDAMEVVMTTEDIFNLKISNEKADGLFTVKLLVDYIERIMKK